MDHKFIIFCQVKYWVKRKKLKWKRREERESEQRQISNPNPNPKKEQMMMMMKKMGRKVFYLSVIWFLVSHVVLKKCEAIWMKVPATGTKCVSEELQSNVVVRADYVVVSENDHPHLTPTIAAKVRYPPLLTYQMCLGFDV